MESLTRTINPPACPSNWDRIPNLPAKGQRMALADEQGYMAQYKVCLNNVWYLLRVWPADIFGIWIVDQTGRAAACKTLEDVYYRVAAWQKVSPGKLSETHEPEPELLF